MDRLAALPHDTVTATITDALHRKVASSEPVNLAFGTRISLLDALAELERILRPATTS